MKIGLALSGGGARGVAHLGILEALEEEGLKPQVISGVSSGAIVGAFYAAGLKPTEILDIFIKTNIFRYIRPAWSKFGFLDIKKMANVFRHYFPVTYFDELKIKLFISATDLKEGRIEVFESGELIPCILASAAMPVLFAPVAINEKLYVDGGVLNNLPIEPLFGNCDYIIGAHCNPINNKFNAGSVKSIMERTFQLAIQNSVKQRINKCDLFIEPESLSRFSLFEISKAREIFKAGYDFAKVAIEVRVKH